MLLITVKSVTYFKSEGTTSRHSELFHHYLYEGTIVQFLIEYEQYMAETDARYANVGMKGWFTLVNWGDVGNSSEAEIATLTNSCPHFGCRVFTLEESREEPNQPTGT